MSSNPIPYNNAPVQQAEQENQQDEAAIKAVGTPPTPLAVASQVSLPPTLTHTIYNAIFGSASPLAVGAGKVAPPQIAPPQLITSDRNRKTDIKVADRSISDFLSKIARIY
jgi:hypothetical protein